MKGETMPEEIGGLTKTVCKTLMGHAGKKYSYREPVQAVQMRGDFTLGGTPAKAGDWIVREQDTFRTVKKEDFETIFKSHRKPRN